MEDAMEVKPVPQVREPSYPTRREVLAGAASFALFSLAGGHFLFAVPEEGKTTVAPIFEHGNGRGVTGCIVVSPPAFLSEEEAMQIIREELFKQGIQLKAGGTLESVLIPSRELRHGIEVVDGKNREKITIVVRPGKGVPLKLDGVDSEKKIEVEFISKENYHDRGGPSSMSSVQRYDFKEVAQYVAEQVNKQDKEPVYFGIFYDPLSRSLQVKRTDKLDKTDRKKEREAREKQEREESKSKLRLQAQDFVAWLKEQKAIQ
jgi:hypothetical protein